MTLGRHSKKTTEKNCREEFCQDLFKIRLGICLEFLLLLLLLLFFYFSLENEESCEADGEIRMAKKTLHEYANKIKKWN